jgi:hypothetical protein
VCIVHETKWIKIIHAHHQDLGHYLQQEWMTLQIACKYKSQTIPKSLIIPNYFCAWTLEHNKIWQNVKIMETNGWVQWK